MSIDVKFLGESFSFNDDLKIYIEALNDCEKISDDLFKAFRTKGNKNEGFIEVKDLHKDMLKGIISTDSFETLRTICGFTDILDKISVIDNTSHNFASKDELDDAYIEFLCKEYTKKIEAKQSELTDARNKKAEEERIRAEEEAARANRG